MEDIHLDFSLLIDYQVYENVTEYIKNKFIRYGGPPHTLSIKISVLLLF